MTIQDNFTCDPSLESENSILSDLSDYNVLSAKRTFFLVTLEIVATVLKK